MGIENKDMPVYPDRWNANLTGITKREYFAAMAMQALVSNHSINASYNSLAREAVSAADALLEELEK